MTMSKNTVKKSLRFYERETRRTIPLKKILFHFENDTENKMQKAFHSEQEGVYCAACIRDVRVNIMNLRMGKPQHRL